MTSHQIRPHLPSRTQVRGEQRLAEWDVEVDWSGWVGPGHLHGARRCRTGVTNEFGPTIGNGHIDKPFDVAAKEVNLVDRLRRAPVAQLRRTVGGQYDQRDATQTRLDDSR